MDKDTNRVGRGKASYPTAFVSPSRYEDRFTVDVHPKVQRLVNILRYKNGTFLISVFVSGNHYYAVELSARLTATREYIFIKDVLGIDSIEMYINYALTKKFACRQIEAKGNQKVIYCMLFIFIKAGIIGRIEEIRRMNGVLNVLQLRDVGARIKADGSYGQLFSRFH